MTEPTICFCAVRKAKFDGHEWKDIKTIDNLTDLVQGHINFQNGLCGPNWTKENPVVRIAQVEIKEV